ncbi:MAG: hypothetical protein QM500_13520 [Methylococcales bacterium]
MIDKKGSYMTDNKEGLLNNKKTDKVQKLIYLIHKNPCITQDNMAFEIGVSINTINRWFGIIKEWYGVEIKRSGSPRNGNYHIDDWGILNPDKIIHKFKDAA